MIMTNFKLNLKGQFNNSQTAVNPTEVGPATVNRRSRLMSVLCLLTLLTLGAGEMWATYYWSAATASDNGNTWGATAMTQSADGYYWYYPITCAKPGGDDGFKIRASDSNWDTSYGYSNVSNGFNNTNITDSWNNSDGNAHFYDSGASYYILFYPTNDVNTTGSPIICAATYLPDNRSCSVYFVNSSSWAGTIYAYGWFYVGTNGRNATWPGASMTNTSKTYNGKTIYSYTFTNSYSTAIFNNNSSQTSDLTMGNSANGKMYDGTNWVTLAYDVTLNQQSGSGGTSSIIATCGSAMPSGKTAPTRTGYTFGGYYTSTGGSGTKYYNADMTSAATWPSNGTGPTTLYAKWTANSYTVTLNTNSGTINAGNVTSYTYGVGATLPTNVTRTGYLFGGWFDNSDCTGDAVTTISTTDTGDKTYYAKWTAITVSATVSPTSGTVGSNSLTFSITSNVSTTGGYYVAVYNFGTSDYAAGYINGDMAYNSSPVSYTGSPNFASEGTWYTRVVVIKDAAIQATSDKISFLVASATYSVTVASANATMGSVSPSSINASESSWSSNITATPNAGYQFVNWTSSGGGITINGSTSNPTQIKATTTGGTLTANFTAATYRVTLDNQSATSAGTEYVDATYNTTTLTSITKPTKTNYTFGGYYTATDGGGTQIIDANGNWLASKSGFTDSSRKSIITENKNLYAKWTETTYAVTVAVDDASHAAGNIACSATGWEASKSGTAQIGNVTNVTITVPAGATGYTYTGGSWTLTGGVTLVSGSLTSPSITVKATATGSATFTYAEDLSTPYVIKGGTAITGSDWSVDIPFTKKSGESTGTVAYAEIPISAALTGDSYDANYNFKVVNGSDWYGIATDNHESEWWYSSSSGEQTLSTGGGNHDNIQLRANVVGTYIVKLDYTSTPKITITWPVALSIYRSNPTDGTNIGDHAWASMPSSTSYRWNLDLEANTTYEFKINDKDTYYGHNTLINTGISNRTFATGTSDTKLETKSAGRFVITYNSSDHKVTVVYPKSAVIGASPTKVYTGGTTTLTGYASELGSGSHTITYEFYKGTTLTDANKIYSTSNTATATYQEASYDATVNFEGNATSQVYTIQIKEGGSVLATNTVTVYRKWDIYVHDVASWNAMYYYAYDNSDDSYRDGWPGLDYSANKYNGTTTWYIVTLDAEYPHFIVDNNAGNKQTLGSGYYETDITTFTPGSFWYTEYNSTAGGKEYYHLTSITPEEPTVTLSASVANCKDITLTGTVTDCGGDGSFASDMKEVYFEVGGTKNAATTVSTTRGTFTKTLSDATAGTTNTLQAFAENVAGTGSSSAIYYSNVTLDLQSGTTGTTAVTAVNGFAMPAGATAPSKTGYTFGGYYASTGGSGKQYYDASMGSANNWDQTTKDKTIYAKWTAITYTVHFNGNGNTGGSMTDQTGIVYDSGTTLTANAFEKTGYNFAGWATTQERATAGTVDRTDGAAHGNLASTQGATAQLWAVWTPKTCTVTFDYQSSAEGYAGAGTLSNVTATYDAAMPALTGNMPTAAQGYAFMGFYSETGGNGTLYYNPDKTSAHNWDVDTESTTTLYAYYKKAEITDVVLNAGIFNPVAAGDPETYVTADPTLDPTPAPTIRLCWELRYSNDNPVTGHDPISVSGNQVKFLLNGLAAGGYKIHVELRTGSTCGAGTLLSSYDKSFSIASDHIVTIQYKCGDFTLKAPTSVGGKPLDWSEAIYAADITGYTFDHWEAGEGVTLSEDGEDATMSGESEANPIYIQAIYDSKLTAVYNKKRVIYFYNTLGWSNVYVYFYKNDSYWGTDDNQGSGANTTYIFTGTPYSEGLHGQMLPIEEGSSIYYFDAEAAGVNASYTNVVFTEINQHGCNYFYDNNKVVRRGDYQSTTLPMFVPLANQTPEDKNNNTAKYYNKGYWMNYPENTGYTLRIYNTWNADNATGASREYMIPFSTDKKMPLKQDVEINFSGETWFLIYRNDGNYLQGSHTFKQNDHGDKAMTSTSEAGSASKMKVISDAEGIYTFTLSFHGNGANPEVYSYYVNVEFPAAVGDYRIVYQDNATWSQSTAHDASWNHPSRVIPQIKGDATEDKKDTVSFFISVGSSPTMKFQKIESINATTGAVTWTDVASGSITIPSSITESGVYNFIVTQPVGGASISLEKAEPYTGNFYIRTDGAGSTKWDNYQANDHQMTYTEFSMSAANSFGDKYSHYFMHWSPGGTNIKFVVANDYSPCISDTLEYDLHDWGNLNAGGQLKHEDGKSETEDIYSANVRFMYNQETNKISRAYVASSTNASRLFLVLRGNEEVRDENGTAVSDQGVTNGAILSDKENWIYERILYIKPNSRFKLFACYAEASPTQSGAQYFRGAYDSDNFTTDANSVILISGTGSYQKARILYDFKTNRLVCAWLPSDEPIDETLDIDADVMVIRDHQEAAECITFANGESKLDGVKTVYGAMKFNRWTLNNRARGERGVEDNDKDHCDTPEDITRYHAILSSGEQKSIYERSLYFISFPFDVKLSEVFGFGQYGTHWVIQYYDGLNRARNGYWLDSPPNWKYVSPAEVAQGYTLNAYQGYLLNINLNKMAYDDNTFWANNISNVELYFPSKTSMSSIKQTEVTIPALEEEYRCTINRGTAEGDRRIKDSFWRCIGVPSYNEFAGELKSGNSSGSTIAWQTSYNTFPFLYVWNMSDNTLTAQSTSNFSFKPMHAYLVQIQDAIYWNMVSATPASIVARRVAKEAESEYNWRLALSRDSLFEDQTYIRMSDIEQITDSFDFGQDLVKELNSRSNLYTYIGYEKVAANSMPVEREQTTVVPVGVTIKNAGEYTFAMPEGTNGVGVTLVDTEANVRTSLGALDYTVSLEAGEYTGRFVLEISPIQNTPTDLGNVQGDNVQGTKARKVMVDGILYIVKDGKMYDARGARVE